MRVFFVINIILLLFVLSLQAGEQEFTFTNSRDQTEQKAVAYIPGNYDADTAIPLLVIAHYMGGNRFTAHRQGYYDECERRNWLLVCPELHGKRTPGETSLAALEAQHDVMDAVRFIQERYHVDTTRIYLAGRSMGGMLGQILGAKYPDIFAAVVSGQGISDLKLWYETTVPRLRDMAIDEMHTYSPETAFDYERRSSVNYARNFCYLPLVLWHGTNDTWVPPEQSEKLFHQIQVCNRFQEPVHWLGGAAHASQNYTAKWVCDQFEFYQNKAEMGMELPHRFFSTLDLVTDEAKWFFWLYIKPLNENSFARAKVSMLGQTLTINTESVSEIQINYDLIPDDYNLTQYLYDSDERPSVILWRDDQIAGRVEPGAEKTGPVIMTNQ